MVFLALLVACGGRDRATRVTMVGWAEVLRLEVATSKFNKFPERLGDIEPEMRAHLTLTDAWGKDLSYVMLRTDIYFLVSAGPDGVFGNPDDIVMINDHFRDAAASYAEHPQVPKRL
jgi:hypothetical protein